MTSTTTRNNLIGIASLCVGVLVFSVQDLVIKAVSGELAVTLAIVVRALVAFPILTAMVGFGGGLKQLDTPHWPIFVARGFIMLTAYTTYFMAISILPLAEVVAIFLAVPLLVTVMAGLLLGEKVSIAAWCAVLLGLVGVGVISWPGSGIFEPAALLPLISAATYAYGMILSRKHGLNVSASVMTFYLNVTYLVGALLFGAVMMAMSVEPPGHPSVDFLVRDWTVPAPLDLSLLAVCGVIAALGSVLLTHGYRKGAANVVAPFEYTGLVWSVLFGFLFFNEVPGFSSFFGMVLIVLAGLLALRAGSK